MNKGPEEAEPPRAGAAAGSKGKKRQREGQDAGERSRKDPLTFREGLMAFVRLQVAVSMDVYAGRVTNAEVLEMLRGGEDGGTGPTRRSSAQATKLAPIEEQVIEYLLTTPAGAQTVPNAVAFLQEATSLGLTEVEKLQALNLRPALPVEVHLVVESCEQRLGDEGIDRFIQVVEKHLPPMPAEKQEEAG